MTVPLSTRSAAWRELALPGTLVVLDFDGTLARIVRDREAARLSARTRRVLAKVAARYPVAVVSGRSSADVAGRLDGLPVRWVIGSHGADWPGDAAAGPHRWCGRIAAWRRTLAERLEGLAGIDIEDKGHSLTVHYRAARDGVRAAAAIARAAADLTGAVAIPGKRVLNLLPEGAADKGSALQRLAAASGAARLLFVGDDVTDEVAFRARLPIPAVMVRVGPVPRSAARYHVRRRGDVDRLLASLAALRDPPRRGRRAR